MRAVVIFLVLIAAVIAALYLAGVFETGQDPANDPGRAGANGGGGTGTGGAGAGGTGSGELAGTRNDPNRPPPEVIGLSRETRMLILTPFRDSFVAWINGTAFGDRANLSWQTWYTREQDPALVERGTHLRPVLTEAPDAGFLASEKIDILVLCDLDPADFDDAFWEAVQNRVEAGDMGLWLQAAAPMRHGEASSESLEAHLYLTHPVLSALAPVAEWAPYVGDPENRNRLPGTFAKPLPYKVTDAGAAHPATRIVSSVEWSKVYWQLYSEGEYALNTKFCYPVTKVAEGAQVLLEVDAPGDGRIPAVVASDPAKGRVLWIGSMRLGWKAFYRSDAGARKGTVIANWPAWLSGQAK